MTYVFSGTLNRTQSIDGCAKNVILRPTPKGLPAESFGG